MKAHWDKIYDRNPIEKLGWFEEEPIPSLQLITKCNLPKDAVILNVGAGASTLIDELLKDGYKNVIVNDISSSALRNLKLRLGEEQSKKVRWVEDDLTNPDTLETLEQVDLWHDRAVLHFFIDSEEQNAYFDLLKNLVRIKGAVIIATFNLSGAIKCSGLPVFRYNENMLQKKLGPAFIMREAFDYTYQMPSGDTREYVYTLFERLS